MIQRNHLQTLSGQFPTAQGSAPYPQLAPRSMRQRNVCTFYSPTALEDLLKRLQYVTLAFLPPSPLHTLPHLQQHDFLAVETDGRVYQPASLLNAYQAPIHRQLLGTPGTALSKPWCAFVCAHILPHLQQHVV